MWEREREGTTIYKRSGDQKMHASLHFLVLHFYALGFCIYVIKHIKRNYIKRNMTKAKLIIVAFFLALSRATSFGKSFKSFPVDLHTKSENATCS